MQTINRAVRDLFDDIQARCHEGEYNLFLHKHLGDVFYAISLHDAFEKKWGKKLHYIVNPRYEFLMEMFGVTNYSTYDPKWFEIEASEAKFPYMPFAPHASHQYDMMCKDIFSSVPLLGLPFIADGERTNFFWWNHYWCYLWAYNCGIDIEQYKYPVPRGEVQLSAEGREKLAKIGPVEKMVLIAPEGATAVELGEKFWNVIAEAVHAKGYSVIVNSARYRIAHGTSAIELGLSLRDVVALGLRCAYVFSLRTGLCDVLVGAGSRLYTLYPATLRRETGSLHHPFAVSTGVHEVLFYRWKTSPLVWEGEDLTPALQREINKLHRRYILAKLKGALLLRKGKYRARYTYCRDVAGESKRFGDNNVDNPKPIKQSWLCKSSWDPRRDTLRRSYLGGLFYTVSKNQGKSKRVHVCGLQVYQRNGLRRKALCFSHVSRKKWLEKLDAQIAPEHDDIYLFRHNLGETCVELMHLAERIRVKGSRNPIIIIRDAKYLELYKMYMPSDLAYKVIPLDQHDIMSVFCEWEPSRPDVVLHYKGRRFICSSPKITASLKKAHKKDPKLNFYTYINRCVGVAPNTPPALPKVPEELRVQVQSKLAELGIRERFVLIVPEASTLEPLAAEYWQQIVEGLRQKGYDIYWNAYNTQAPVEDVKSASLSVGELMVVAEMADGVISLACGMGLVLSNVATQLDLIYTDFAGKVSGCDASLAQELYSANHLPPIAVKGHVREHDTKKTPPGAIVQTVLSFYPEQQG